MLRPRAGVAVGAVGEVTRAVQAAIYRADSLGYFLGQRTPPGLPKGTVRLSLTTTAGATPPDGGPILRVRMPFIPIETPAEVL